jgi:DNA topoisomerase IA
LEQEDQIHEAMDSFDKTVSTDIGEIDPYEDYDSDNSDFDENSEQEKLYKLIWERTVSSQMSDAKLLKTKIIANIFVSPAKGKSEEGSIPDFTANGSRIIFPGWLSCDQGARGEDVELPKVEIDEEIAVEWSRIPHFYNSFYVYKYATGFFAATSISVRIINIT